MRPSQPNQVRATKTLNRDFPTSNTSNSLLAKIGPFKGSQKIALSPFA
jgi:hypothetical protein